MFKSSLRNFIIAGDKLILLADVHVWVFPMITVSTYDIVGNMEQFPYHDEIIDLRSSVVSVIWIQDDRQHTTSIIGNVK